MPGSTTLCLSNGRFKVSAARQSPTASGQATAVALTPDTGYFWFFDSSNVEMILKVLDACSVNGKKWVLAGGLTNVNVVVTVTDAQTGAVRTYVNPQNTAFQPIQDTSAFSTCPWRENPGQPFLPAPPCLPPPAWPPEWLCGFAFVL